MYLFHKIITASLSIFKGFLRFSNFYTKDNPSQTAKTNYGLLDKLNALNFYQRKHPKSVYFEFVKGSILLPIESFEIPIEDKLCTFAKIVAFQTAQALPKIKGRILTTGVGAYNDFLNERVHHYLPELEIAIPLAKTLELRETSISTVLDILKLRIEINILSTII